MDLTGGFAHRPRKWGQEGPGPLQYLWVAIHVIGLSLKMLNQHPVIPVSALTLAMTNNNIKIVATKCQILRLKCTKSFKGWGSTPDPAYIVYILYTYFV